MQAQARPLQDEHSDPSALPTQGYVSQSKPQAPFPEQAPSAQQKPDPPWQGQGFLSAHPPATAAAHLPTHDKTPRAAAPPLTYPQGDDWPARPRQHGSKAP